MNCGCLQPSSCERASLLPQQRINELQRVMGAAEAPPLAGVGVFVGAARLCVSLLDDAQRKSPRDWVKDHGPQALRDGLSSANVEADQGRNVVETIVFELEQLPSVALWWHRGRCAGEGLKQSFNHRGEKIFTQTNLLMSPSSDPSIDELYVPCSKDLTLASQLCLL